MTLRMQVMQLMLLLVLMTTVRASPEHRVSFSEDYNSQLLPPTEDGGPVVIQASINLRNILDVAEKEQIISLETTLRLYWKDTRVKPLEKYLEGEDQTGQYVTLNP